MFSTLKGPIAGGFSRLSSGVTIHRVTSSGQHFGLRALLLSLQPLRDLCGSHRRRNGRDKAQWNVEQGM